MKGFLYVLPLLFQLTVDVVFRILLLFFKTSRRSFYYVTTTHLISTGFFPYVVTVVSLSSGSNFPHVFATLFEKAMHVFLITFSNNFAGTPLQTTQVATENLTKTRFLNIILFVYSCVVFFDWERLLRQYHFFKKVLSKFH